MNAGDYAVLIPVYVVIGAAVMCYVRDHLLFNVLSGNHPKRRAAAIGGILTGLVWPLLSFMIVPWTWRGMKWFVLGVGELYRHFVPKKVKVPRATAVR